MSKEFDGNFEDLYDQVFNRGASQEDTLTKEREQKAERRKIEIRRRNAAAYRAHKMLEALHAETYANLYENTYARLEGDPRYDTELIES